MPHAVSTDTGDSAMLKFEAAKALAKLGDPRARETLEEFAKQPGSMRLEAEQALTELRAKEQAEQPSP